MEDEAAVLEDTAAVAASRVFSIPELLETILAELPFQDVLRFTRINKTFQDTVKSFPKLQHKLFYQQDTSATAAYATAPSINPILQTMFDFFSTRNELRWLPVVKASSDLHRYHYYERYKRANHTALARGSQYVVWLHAREPKHPKMEELVKWMRSKKLPWHDMYVTDRPCEIVVMFGSWEGEYSFPSDIKMEELLRHLTKRYRYRFKFNGWNSKARNEELSEKRTRSRRRGRTRDWGWSDTREQWMTDHQKGWNGNTDGLWKTSLPTRELL